MRNTPDHSSASANIILATPDDERLTIASNAPIRYEQRHDGVIFLVISANASDDALQKAASKFGLSLQTLLQFQTDIA